MSGWKRKEEGWMGGWVGWRETGGIETRTYQDAHPHALHVHPVHQKLVAVGGQLDQVLIAG